MNNHRALPTVYISGFSSFKISQPWTALCASKFLWLSITSKCNVMRHAFYIHLELSVLIRAQSGFKFLREDGPKEKGCTSQLHSIGMPVSLRGNAGTFSVLPR